MRDATYRLYTQGQGSVLTYLEGQRQFNEVVRQYLDALIRHRRSMLRLNTAAGQRILP
jgi:cobalt-zinc-cadmium efflux system outer membrane protein